MGWAGGGGCVSFKGVVSSYGSNKKKLLPSDTQPQHYKMCSFTTYLRTKVLHCVSWSEDRCCLWLGVGVAVLSSWPSC